MANEERLIDANALIAILEKIAKEDKYNYFHLDEITQEIFDSPTVDAVEVVRCKDCKWWIKADNGSWHMVGRTDGICRKLNDIHHAERYMTEGEHFCSYGERRTDG